MLAATVIDISFSRLTEGVACDLHSWSNPICTRCHCKELITPMDAARLEIIH